MIQIAPSRHTNVSIETGRQKLVKLAEQRISQGLAPPSEIYRIEYRRHIDWLKFPDWARPVDPQLFDGCCHEG